MVPFNRIGRVDQLADLCRVLKIAAQVLPLSAVHGMFWDKSRKLF